MAKDRTHRPDVPHEEDGHQEGGHEEDGPESAGFSSPPCFMHELAPEYLGYMGAAELDDLLSRIEAIVAAGGGVIAGRLCEALRHGTAPRIDGLSPDAKRRGAALLDETLIRIQPSPVRDGLEALRRRLAAADDTTR